MGSELSLTLDGHARASPTLGVRRRNCGSHRIAYAACHVYPTAVCEFVDGAMANHRAEGLAMTNNENGRVNEIELLDVTKLRLDSLNPRLPEQLHGAGQAELLEYLHDNTSLDELLLSFVDNSYFSHEPLIVLGPDENGEYGVLEGNRRLASLTILLQLETAQALGLEYSLGPAPAGELLDMLRAVPCVTVSDREQVHRFLGFRHIGGIKTWSAEAKARYIIEEVRRTRTQHPESDVFRLVGRVVGSNALGVRNPYIAMRILIYGREQFGLDVSYVQQYRFGVWNRAMNSPDLRAYIGFGNARTFDEIEAALDEILLDRLREVLADLVPDGHSRRATLGDSRDVTIYAQVLQDTQARDVLRRHNDLALARQVIEQASVSERIREISRSVEILVQELGRGGASVDALEPAVELLNLARALHDLINARLSADN